ncbi:MAG TPA: NADH-ubiquinone oxidoreductase-F iron-sulfur binding region domain-containing protein [Myxococcota bacterium]|nr:NADH-ubiquinone oxidoreductase-F iron-sulfur binding region domain-containing protein [Myxococcota bacterium]
MRALHGLSDPLPWEVLRTTLDARGVVTETDLIALASRLGLPPVRLRAALASFADLAEPTPRARVCRGTSCELHGAPRLAERVGSVARPAYCLGHCDRSPVALDAVGRVQALCATGPADGSPFDREPAPAPTTVRSLAREPIVTRRIGRGDFSRLADARADGAWRVLEAAIRGGPEAVLEAIEASGERGRGGAGFSTGAKWRAARSAPGGPRYVVANGDEGDPGSFVDRVLLESDPHGVLEGLALCAFAVGASEAIVFVRSEYPLAIARVEEAIADAERAGWLGSHVRGSGFSLRVRVFRGLGSYVCGEETALLNAIEGRRGEVRLRPPYPTEVGLFGRPTVVNNVETLVNVPWIVERGPAAFAALGTPASRGTKALCLNATFPRPGIVEVPFGTSLRTVLEEVGGVPCDAAHLDALLVGGPMGSVLLPEECDLPICYGAMAERGIELGHGGMVGVPAGSDLAALAVHLLTFMAEESCGKCVPCRAGSARALALARADWRANAEPLDRVLAVAADASLCAFGQAMPAPIRRLLALAAARSVS